MSFKLAAGFGVVGVDKDMGARTNHTVKKQPGFLSKVKLK